MQTEITTPGPLLSHKGLLTQPGYARFPFLKYDRSQIRAGLHGLPKRLRVKEWDYYGVITDRYFFSVCVSDVGYIGLVFAYFIDFESGEIYLDQVITPFGADCHLPDTSESGDIFFSNARVDVGFLREPEKRHIRTSWKNMGGVDVSADFAIRQPQEWQGIVMATPMERGCFYYNHKLNGMPVSGNLEIGGRKMDLGADRALACLDWGRGVWPYSTFWNWASGSGYLHDGRILGLNLGSGFGDLSAATENSVFVDGVMSKLGWVDLQYSSKSLFSPWLFTEESGRLHLRFTPIFRRKENTNLAILRSKVNQMFGRYNGYVITDEGESIEVVNMIGWAEEHYARW